MKLTAIGIDLAKNVFQVHGVDERGQAMLRQQLKRAEVATFFANLEPCLIGMEACGSAHHGARKLSALGHGVKPIAPQFVKPYVKSNKNDVADAEAIGEAGQRPTMRFVPVKTPPAQALLARHRARQGFVKARPAQTNPIRGLRGEFGIVVPQGIAKRRERIPRILEDDENARVPLMRARIERRQRQLTVLDKEVRKLEAQSVSWHRHNEKRRRLADLPGLGPITASAWVAAAGDAPCFQNGRQLAAWLGPVPRRHSRGGKPTRLGISKRGDTYLRTLLIHGARAVLKAAAKQADPGNDWLTRLSARRHKNIAAVALANQNARTVWALLAHDRTYSAHYSTGQTAASSTPHQPKRSQDFNPSCPGTPTRDGKTGRTEAGKTRSPPQARVERDRLLEKPASRFHQGQRPRPRTKAGCMAAIFTYSSLLQEGLVNRGRPGMG